MDDSRKDNAAGSASGAGAGRLIALDAVIMILAFVVMYFVRFKSGLMGFSEGKEGYRDLDYYMFFPCGAAIWALAIYIVRGYEADARAGGGAALTRLAAGTVLALLLIGVADAMARASMPEMWNGFSRKYLLLSMGLGFVGMIAARLAVKNKR